jgi:hypothetical protein
MGPRQAAEAAATLAQAMTKTADANALSYLAQGLSAVAARMEPGEAARVCAEPAASLAQALTKTTNPAALSSLAQALSAVAARMEPGQAAATLAQAMTKTGDSLALYSLARGLSAVAARMAPGEGARVCAQAAAPLAQAMTKTTDPRALSYLAQGLAAVAARMEPGQAAEVATTLLQAITKMADLEVRKQLARGIIEALTGVPSTRQALTAAATVACPSDGRDLPATLALLTLAAEPPPRRLSTQDLVDLLKHPLFVGDARRVVLDQLENRYHRTFADQWEFVRFAHEHLPDVDLDSPWKRPTPPDRAAPADAMK